MRIVVVGTGYVGLVTGICLAHRGHKILFLDSDRSKIHRLKNGEIPIHEPDLENLFLKSDVSFTKSYGEAVRFSDTFMIAVGTPSSEDGSADLSDVIKVARKIAKRIKRKVYIVNRSTCPVGTARKIREIVERASGFRAYVASNPEFLRAGRAVEDFLGASRIIVGTDSLKAKQKLLKIYSGFKNLVFMDIESAELGKYCANGMLALRISFMNQMARLCEKVGANIKNVERIMGFDYRIGKYHLEAGIGYGGSCFPKDVRALSRMLVESGLDSRLIDEIELINARQRKFFVEKIENFFGGRLFGRKFCVLGLAFKPGTDDVRESPAIDVIKYLKSRGAIIKVYDPKVKSLEGLETCKKLREALSDVEALVLVTDWSEFCKVKPRLGLRVVFDGRNILDAKRFRSSGVEYFGIGDGSAVR